MRNFNWKYWLIGVVIYICCMLLGFVLLSNLRSKSGNLTYVHKEDPELDVAIETAKRSLPDFLKSLADPQPQQAHFAMKAKFQTKAEPEMLWVDNLSIKGDTVTGTLADRPTMYDKKRGDSVSFKLADVVDWTIVDSDGASEGAYTDKVLRKRHAQLGRRVRMALA